MRRQALERKLRKAGLKPTAKRLGIAGLLFEGPDKHLTAEDVMELARRSRLRVSQATVYNTLNQFCAAGLLRRIVLDNSSTFFDTNTSEHHHLFHEDDARLVDLPADAVRLTALPDVAADETIRSVEILLRVGPAD